MKQALTALLDAGGHINEKRVDSEIVVELVWNGLEARAGNGRVVITASGKLFAQSAPTPVKTIRPVLDLAPPTDRNARYEKSQAPLLSDKNLKNRFRRGSEPAHGGLANGGRQQQRLASRCHARRDRRVHVGNVERRCGMARFLFGAEGDLAGRRECPGLRSLHRLRRGGELIKAFFAIGDSRQIKPRFGLDSKESESPPKTGAPSANETDSEKSGILRGLRSSSLDARAAAESEGMGATPGRRRRDDHGGAPASRRWKESRESSPASPEPNARDRLTFGSSDGKAASPPLFAVFRWSFIPPRVAWGGGNPFLFSALWKVGATPRRAAFPPLFSRDARRASKSRRLAASSLGMPLLQLRAVRLVDSVYRRLSRRPRRKRPPAQRPALPCYNPRERPPNGGVRMPTQERRIP